MRALVAFNYGPDRKCSKNIVVDYRRGHEVTVAMPFDVKTDKYTVINSDPDGSILELLDSATTPVLKKQSANPASAVFAIKGGALQLTENSLNNPIMQKLIKDPNTKFDLVIISPFLATETG